MPANSHSSTLGEDEDLGVLDSDAAACDQFTDDRFRAADLLAGRGFP